MKSLYELLGANADDDAEALQKAFRKAVKAHHPDLHPYDPDAQERFREIIAAHAVLGDPELRAGYDLLHQLESKRSLPLAGQPLQSKPALRQPRWRSMLTAAAVVVVAALIGGYGLAIRPMTGNVDISKDDLAAKTDAAVENQTAIVVAAAKENDTPSAAIGPAKAGVVKDNNVDRPVEPVGAIPMQQDDPADRGERRHEHDGAAVLEGATEPSPTLSEKTDIAEQELAPGPPSKHANVYRARGIASYRSGDFPQAIASFNAAISLDPGDAQAYNIRGNTWDEMGDFKSALADYDEAIRINPNNPIVFQDRAIMWRRQGELEKALIDLDRAVRFSFSDAATYCDRGLVWYEMGHHDRAIADFNQAIKLDPNSAAACIRHGLILHRNSDSKLAFANQAIRVDPRILDALRGANLHP